MRQTLGGWHGPPALDLTSEDPARLPGSVQTIMWKGLHSREDVLEEVREAARRYALVPSSAGSYVTSPEPRAVMPKILIVEDNEKNRDHAMSGERALAAGCVDYHTKPTELPELLSQIEAILGGR